MIDTEALRKKVLDLAIRGKLTQQLPEDGTAEELLEQIRKEKQALIKEGKIKKEKPLPPITEDEIPFEVPNNWKWVRIGIIFSLKAGKNITANKIHDASTEEYCYPCFGGNGIRGYVNQTNVSGFHALIGRQGALCGNINFAEGDFYATEHAVVVYDYAGTDTKWAGIALRVLNLNQYATSVAQPGLAVNKIERVLIPLPPLAEQKRIVEKVETIFSVLDKIDLLQSEYLNNLSVLKMKIIEAGIQGKLTEQLPEDGTAEELYEQIQKEKQDLIKEGKIKKEKPLPPITEDEVPFDVPGNWKWVRLGHMSAIINGDRGKNYPAKSTLKKTGIPFISALNLDGKSVVIDEKLLCLSNEQYNKLGSGKLQKDDIVICIRGSLGKHGRYPFEQGAIASSLVISRLYYKTEILREFEILWLDSKVFRDEIEKYNGGVAQPNIAANNLEKFIFPLPPLAEQKRIVAKLDEVLAILDGKQAE